MPVVRLSRPTIFISSPSDMEIERAAGKEIALEIKERLLLDYDVYDWQDHFMSSGRTFQEQIPCLSDPNCRVTICIFGERIGEMVDRQRSGGVAQAPVTRGRIPELLSRFPVTLDPNDSSRVPLTGSVQEFLEAMIGAEKGTGNVLLFAKGDESILTDRPLEDRKFGGRRYLRARVKGLDPATSEFRREQEAYSAQVGALSRFYDDIVGQRRIILFESEADFKVKLKEALSKALKLRGPITESQLFRGLQSYGMQDHYALFGREPDIRGIVRELSEATANLRQVPFLIVSGKSGSGKSSIAKAGVAGGLAVKESNNKLRYAAVDADVNELGTADKDGQRDLSWLARLGRRAARSFAIKTERRKWTPLVHLGHRIALDTRLNRLTDEIARHSDHWDAQRLVAAMRDHLANFERESKQRVVPVIVLDQFEERLRFARGLPNVKARFDHEWLPVVDFLVALAIERLAWVIVPLPFEGQGTDHWTEELRKLEPIQNLAKLGLRLPDPYPVAFPQERKRRLEIIKGPFEAINRPLDDAVSERIRREVDSAAGQDDAAVLPLLSVMLRWTNERHRACLERQLETCKTEAPLQERRSDNASAKGPEGIVPDGELEPTNIALDAEKSTRLVTLSEIGPDISLAGVIDDLGNAALCQFDANHGRELASGAHKVGPSAETIRVLDRLLGKLVKIEAGDPSCEDEEFIRNRRSFGAKSQGAETRFGKDIVELALLLEDARIVSSTRLQSVSLTHMKVLDHWKIASRWCRRREKFERVLPAVRKSLVKKTSGLLADEVVEAIEGALVDGLSGEDIDETSQLVKALRRHYVTLPAGIKTSERLHAAITSRNEELIEFYLQRHVADGIQRLDPDIPDGSGTRAPPIVRLADAKMSRFVSKFIEIGARLDATDASGRTVLHALCGTGDHILAADVLHRLGEAQRNKVLDSRTRPGGWTALHFAASSGSRECALALLRNGANVMAEAEDGSLPMHIAARLGQVASINALSWKWSKRRDQLAHQDRQGFTPLMVGAFHGHGNIIAAVLPRRRVSRNTIGVISRSLHIAALRGLAGPIAPFLAWFKARRLAVPVNESGRSPLHHVARLGHEAVARALLDAGAPSDPEDVDGVTPLMLACQAGELRIATLLLDHGADPARQSRIIAASIRSAHSPLREAVRSGASDVVTLLIGRLPKGRLSRTLNSPDALGLVPLHHAAYFGYLHIVELLLDAGAQADVRDRSGFTPLHVAAMAGQADVAALLIHRTEPNLQTDLGRTPLHLAARYGHGDVVRVLLEQESTAPETRNVYGQTPLHLAAHFGNSPALEALIKRGVTPEIDFQDSENLLVPPVAKDEEEEDEPRKVGQRTALYSATVSGHVPCVQALLAAGADPTIPDVNGATPLHAACRRGFGEIASALVEVLKTRPEVLLSKDARGNTAIDAAAYHGHVELLTKFIDQVGQSAALARNGQQRSFLHSALAGLPTGRATERNALAIARLAIRYGVDVKAVDEFGMSALHYAAKPDSVDRRERFGAGNPADSEIGDTPLDKAREHARVELVRELLAAGADTVLTNSDGRNSLHLAVIGRRYSISKELLAQMPDQSIDLPDMYGKTALHYAATFGDLRVTKSLLKRGARVDSRNRDDESTPLYFACKAGHLEIADDLIRACADVNARSNDGATPLGVAAMQNHLEIARALLANGARIDDPSYKGFTALNAAARFGHVEMAQLLLQKGANPNAEGGRDRSTPVHTAAKFGQVEMLKLLLRNGGDGNKASLMSLTPLHIVARDSPDLSLSCLQVLLDRRANPFLVDHWGRTPAHLAASEGAAEALQLLLHAGPAAAKLQDKKGQTPLDIWQSKTGEDAFRTLVKAKLRRKIEAAEPVIPERASFMGLLKAAAEETAEPVGPALRQGESVNVSDDREWTALHHAARRGDKGMVLALLRQGAAIDARNEMGGLPIHEAAYSGSIDALGVLLNQMPVESWQITNDLGQTALHRAMAGKSIDAVQALLDKEFNIRAVDKEARTPLHLAAVGSSRVDLQACKLEYSIVSPK